MLLLLLLLLLLLHHFAEMQQLPKLSLVSEG